MNGGRQPGMSLIVRMVTECLRGLILLYGIYMVAYGHLTPGGGFPGGVVLASAFVLITLAEGQRVALKVWNKAAAKSLDSLGALIFWGAAVSGIFAAGVFFRNVITTSIESRFRLLSAGIIPICNLGIGLKVGASLFLVFTVLSSVHVVPAGAAGRESRGGQEQ